MSGLHSKQTLIQSKFQGETMEATDRSPQKNTVAFTPLYRSTFLFFSTGIRHMHKVKPGGTAQGRAGWLSFCPHHMFSLSTAVKA